MAGRIMVGGQPGLMTAGRGYRHHRPRCARCPQQMTLSHTTGDERHRMPMRASGLHHDRARGTVTEPDRAPYAGWAGALSLMPENPIRLAALRRCHEHDRNPYPKGGH